MPRAATVPFLATLTAALLVLAAGPAFAGKTPPAPKPPKPSTSKTTTKTTTPKGDSPAVKAAKAQLKMGEATVLRDAYLLMSAANADYDGHRGHAMGAIQSAVYALDKSVAANGTNSQKAATLIQDNAAARAKAIDTYLWAAGAGVKKNQITSDLQMQAAAQLLGVVRPNLVKHNQPYVLGKVDYAIKEIAIALAIR